MTQIRNTKKQWVRKCCCRSVAAELLSTGKHVHSQIILILISYNLSQFVVWALPRSVKPRLSTPYLGVVTSGLWVTTVIWASWGSEVLWLLTGSGKFERQQPSSAWKWPNLLCPISFVRPCCKISKQGRKQHPTELHDWGFCELLEVFHSLKKQLQFIASIRVQFTLESKSTLFVPGNYCHGLTPLATLKVKSSITTL